MIHGRSLPQFHFWFFLVEISLVHNSIRDSRYISENFAIRHELVDLFPEFSLVDPRTYPCFQPEGFDPYPRRQKPHKNGRFMNPLGILLGARYGSLPDSPFRPALLMYIQSGMTCPHLHLDLMMPF